ncbi:MAG: GGDEF domain-containing protein [Clostridiales bacterium]|nr:GGDEF domain-containing protein [Clostridiales bacterium]
MKPSWKKTGRTVFHTAMQPLVMLILLQAAILLVSLYLSGIFGQVNSNERSILGKQVVNRANYLEIQMTQQWSDIAELAQSINRKTQAAIEQGAIRLDLLENDSKEASKLIGMICTDMIETMYRNKNSGIYVIFNTSSLDGNVEPKTGFHVRDFDPKVNATTQYSDLLLECAPISTVKAMNISTDTGWDTRYDFGTAYGDYFRKPFMEAYRATRKLEAVDYACWNSSAQSSLPSGLTYSMPLMLEDGTLYGVLGVELLDDYVSDSLPYDELGFGTDGTYMLALFDKETNRATLKMVSGKTRLRRGETIALTPGKDGSYAFEQDGKKIVTQMDRLTVYDMYAPFDSETWVLMGATTAQSLYAFSKRVSRMILLAIALMLIFDAAGSVLIARRLSKPIEKLSKEVDIARMNENGIPRLSITGIREIDHFAEAFAGLSREAINTSTRFLRMLDMASVDIAGCEFDTSKEADVTPAFATDNFFPLLGVPNGDAGNVTLGQIKMLQSKMTDSILSVEKKGDSTLLHVRSLDGKERYVRLKETQIESRTIVLAEDVTTSTLERLRIERERDYDLLTGLYNRRAFYRFAGRLFDRPDKMKHAAVVMMDLDNLKRTNDTFGHEWGDRYIHEAAVCFLRNIPDGTLCARVSGDEFNILFCGYDSREAVQRAIDRLVSGLENSHFNLPDGQATRIHVSGGIAWYPEDGTELMELIKCADFAMYQMKRNEKGRFGVFDRTQYNQTEGDMSR